MVGIIAAFQWSGDYHFIPSSQEELSSPLGNFKHAVSFSIDPSGNFYVLDAEINELLKLSRRGELLQSSGGYGWSQIAFDHPTDVIAPNGLDVYVADEGNHRIQHFDRNLNYVSSLRFRDNEDVSQRFGYPRSVAVSRLGDLFLTDGENIRIVKIINNNTFDRAFGGQGGGEGQLQNPSRVRVSTTDLVYVQDGNVVKVFDIFGNYVRTIGAGIFSHLKTFTIDQKHIYVMDSCIVRMLNEHGAVEDTVSTVLGNDQNENCDAVDIAVEGTALFILSSRHIFVKTLYSTEHLEK